ncbi:flagellar filament capping protein FliD [Paenibacillus sp. VCA1]|uniref:flagellar filament capping protein FliD n=1 Tax=Paenibacillus sp. VCA1 TaxID=3039148 RepID=UPI0028720F82|nr:flagellar filament capping protein FliD [Paenibacillus sp. VCA1]MDR9853365.1 flagellar filament capping protein FliD [Paenibacillus sp. VCA1]
MAGISSPTRLTGFSGTLDTESLIQKLMKAERLPLDNVQKKKQFTLWKREDYQTMNTTLLSFRNTVNNLRFEKNFEKVTATSSNTSVISITSNGTNVGTSNVTVTQLAESATLIGGVVSAKSSDTVNVSGTVTIEGALGSTDVTFTSGQSTIDSIMKDINSKSALTGVTASFDQSSGRLFLTSTSTGAKSKVNVTGAEFSSLFNLTGTSASGKDAEYTVNGTKITASSNNVTIGGAQVMLSGIGTASIGSKADRSSIIDDIKKFVEQYNSLIDTFYKAYTTKQNRNYEPLTDEQRDAMSESQIEKWEKTAREGTLYNDSILKDSLSNMRQALNMPLNVPKGQISMLSEIGITVKSDWRENGKLEIDEAKLEAAINTNFDQVKQLFVMSSSGPEVAGKSNLGIADRLYNIVNDQMDAIKKKIGLGSIDALDDSVMGKQLKELSEQEAKWKSKLQDIEDRYYKQFSAMEQAIQKLNSQQSSFASLLGG